MEHSIRLFSSRYDLRSNINSSSAQLAHWRRQTPSADPRVHDSGNNKGGNRRQREDAEPDSMTENAQRHRLAPAQPFKNQTEDGHRADLRYLADAHHGHDPVSGNPHRFALEKGARPDEIALVDRR